jgi:putative ABC transport system substrate-binding protein
MHRRRFVLSIAIGLLTARIGDGAQPATSVYRIGWLGPGPAPPQDRDEIWPELHALGYTEGQNLIVERRRDKNELLPSLAAELVQLRVELILTFGSDATLAAKNATTSIPIVMIVGDPVAFGFVSSLGHPEGNITGYSLASSDVARKRAALLQELLPAVQRVGILVDPKSQSSTFWRNLHDQAYRSLGMQPIFIEVTEAWALEDAVAEVVRRRGQALDFVYSSLFDGNQRTIMEAALRNALPVSAPVRDFLELGALIAYDPDPHELQARVSTIIDKILRGAKPSTIPIAQPARFKLLLNLKAAKRLGIKVPRAVLLRVDEVIQ